MKILVCISSVPDTTSKINFTANNEQFDTAGVQFIINPSDEFALTKAVILKEQMGASVTLVTVGDAQTEPVLRKAFAVGADEIIRVDANASDSFFVAFELSKIAKEGNFDLVFTGKESIDYNGGMVGAMVASLLEIPFINKCVGLEVSGNSVKAESEIDGGKAIVSGQFPIVVAAQKGLVAEKDLRIPNMRNLMAARTKPITVLPPQGVSSETKIIQFEKLPPKNAVKIISEANLDELATILIKEAGIS